MSTSVQIETYAIHKQRWELATSMNRVKILLVSLTNRNECQWRKWEKHGTDKNIVEKVM
jgi:hypothetical protein